MKLTDTLATLFHHHLWANLVLFELCATLTPEQLEAKIAGSFGTIYETLEHIALSERVYLSRISTGQRYQQDPNELRLTIPQLIDSLRQTGNGFLEWIGKVQASDTVEVDWDGVPRNVPKTILLTQVINHGTEHREQIKAILTQIGIEPPDLQGWAYFDAVDTAE